MNRLSFVLLLFTFTCISTNAQTGGFASGPAVQGEVTKLSSILGAALTQSDVDFTADVSITSRQLPKAAEMKLSVAGGKIRWDVDTLKMVPDPTAQQMVRNLKIDQMAMLMERGKDLVAIYPRLNAWVKVDAASHKEFFEKFAAKDIEAALKEVGTETINGQSTTKYQVSNEVADLDAGESAFVWRARDLENLPIRIQATESGQTWQIDLSTVKIGKVDSSKFSVPAHWKQYPSVEQLIMGAMQAGGQFPGLGQ